MTQKCIECGGVIDWTPEQRARMGVEPKRCTRCVCAALDAGFIAAGEEPVLTRWETVRPEVETE